MKKKLSQTIKGPVTLEKVATTLDELATTVDKLALMTQEGFVRLETEVKQLRKETHVGFEEARVRTIKLESAHDTRITRLERDNRITKDVLVREFDITYGRK